MSSEWYAVKGLFRWYFKEGGATERIEERVVLFQAGDFDEALNLAEMEGRRYCVNDEHANFGIEPLGWWSAYWIGGQPSNGVEVFSRSCNTRLSGQSFLRRYYPKCHGTDG